MHRGEEAVFGREGGTRDPSPTSQSRPLWPPGHGSGDHTSILKTIPLVALRSGSGETISMESHVTLTEGRGKGA